IPGLTLFNNNSLSFRLTGPGNLGGSLSQQGTGRVTLALSNSLALNFITNDHGTIVFDSPVNFTLPAVITESGFMDGTIIKANTNELTLSGDNSTYYGTFIVSNGVLRYNNSMALGSTINSLYVTNANA